MKESYDQLLSNYHKSLKTNNDEFIIATTLKLAEYFYENDKFYECKHHLDQVSKINKKILNLNTYYALLEIQKSNNLKASKYLDMEIKNFPNNSYAKELREQITISYNFPIMSILFFILNLSVFLINGTSNTFEKLLRYSLNINFISVENIFSSIFSHVDLTHFLINSSLLILIGVIAEKKIGSLKFTIIYLASGIIGNLSEVYFGFPNTYVLGASGAIFGIFGALLMKSPLLEMRLLGIIKMPLIILLGLFFSLTFLFPEVFSESAQISHLFGLFTGMLITGVYFNSTIIHFYFWLAISTGFFLLVLFVNFLKEKIYLIELIVLNILFLVMGSFLILWGYLNLKLRGSKNE